MRGRGNHWGVEPGQVWARPDIVLLVLHEVKRERFNCLVLQSDLRQRRAGEVVSLTAFVAQHAAERLL